MQSKDVERKGNKWSSPKLLVVGIKSFLISTETPTRLSTMQNSLPAVLLDGFFKNKTTLKPLVLN